MNSVFQTWIVIILCFPMGAGFVRAAAFQILSVEEPPSSYRNSAGKPEGLVIDIVGKIQERLGNRDPVQIVTEARALYIASRSANVVLLGFSRIPEREQRFYWILPYLQKPWVLYTRKGSGLAVQNLNEAQTVDRIGVVRRDVRALYLEKLGFKNLAPVSNHEQNVKKILLDRITMFAYDPVGLAYVCKKLDVAPGAFQPVLELKTSVVYIMMSRQGTRPETAEQWRAAAQALKDDGTLGRIAQQWADRVGREIGITGVVHDGILTFTP